MKSNSLLLILFIFITATLFPQVNWQQMNSGVNRYLQDVFFISKDTGWAVGYESTILKTINGGQSWTIQTASTNENFLSVNFIDKNNGWVGCSNGKILKTTNGGQNWQIISTGFNEIYSIWFLNNNLGFALSSYITNDYRIGSIIKTTNGGNNWSVVFNINDFGLIDLFFNQERGWAVGTNGFIVSTSDMGNNWFIVNRFTDHWLYDIFFIDKTTGWSVGGNVNTEVIYKTIDGGLTWTQQLLSFQYQWLTGVSFINREIGWACGFNGVILKTTNGGNSWNKENVLTNKYLRKVVFPDSTTGYIVGENGIILKNKMINNLNLIKPNGGEIILSGSNYSIEWTSQNVLNVKIELSTDAGFTWTTIIDSIESTGIYNWNVPPIISNQCLIKISNLRNQNDFDISNNFFSIISSKTINVLYPNGGEIFQGNSEVNILWNSTDVASVKLEFSSNNGASWNIINLEVPSTGIYNWLVPNVNTIQGRIKITDKSDTSIFDISDASFRINRVLSVEDNSYDLLDFDIKQNFPNPFNPLTVITFTVPEETFVTIKIFDPLGNIVQTLVNELVRQGKHSVEFNASNLSSGVYYCTLITNKFNKSIKLNLLK